MDTNSARKTFDPADQKIYDAGVKMVMENTARIEAADSLDGQGEVYDGMIILPNDLLEVNKAAENIFSILAKTNKIFVRAGAIVEVKKSHGGLYEIRDIDAKEFRSRLGAFGKPVFHWVRPDKRTEAKLSPKTCSMDTANLLMGTLAVYKKLPHIQLVSESAVLAEVEGCLKVLTHGYHGALGGVFITGRGTLPDIALDEAVTALHGILGDFHFQSDGDYSRAIASIITPALRIGGLFNKQPVPIDFAEADQSQSGKTYRQKVVRAIYGEKSYMVSKRKGGVGSLDESISAGLLSGRPFVALENLRGNIDSEILEAAITWDEPINVRVPYRGEVPVSATHITFQITSNGVQTTVDLANRSSIVRIRKHPEGYPFREYSEGDLLDHITENQPYYMGCVAAVVREWVNRSKPKTNEARHTFRYWVRSLDWIVQNLFNCAPLMDDHAEAHARLSDPKLKWLREVAIEVEKSGKLGKELTASEIFDISEMNDIDFPNGKQYLDDKRGRQAVGTFCKAIYDSAQAEVVTIDHFNIARESGWDLDHAREVKKYVFSIK